MGCRRRSGKWLTWRAGAGADTNLRAVDLMDGTLYFSPDADQARFSAELGIETADDRIVIECPHGDADEAKANWIACDERGMVIVESGSIEYRKWVTR